MRARCLPQRFLQAPAQPRCWSRTFTLALAGLRCQGEAMRLGVRMEYTGVKMGSWGLSGSRVMTGNQDLQQRKEFPQRTDQGQGIRH